MRYVIVLTLALLTASCATFGDQRGNSPQASVRPDGVPQARVIPQQAP